MPLRLTHIEHASEGPETRPPLLIAHGLFGSARNFNTLGKRLAAGRRVVMVDMRNHGASPWDDDVSYGAMAADLAEAIGRLCAGRAVVMGHSMGGKAAMALALTRPDLVAGAIIADIAPVAYPHAHLAILRAMRDADLSGVARRSQGDALMAGAIPEAGLRGFILQNLVIEDGRARWRLNLAALEDGMPDLTGWPTALDALTFAGPALFIHGAASDYMDASRSARVRALFPAARIEAIAGAGHWLHAEKPAEFLAAVSAWLDALPG